VGIILLILVLWIFFPLKWIILAALALSFLVAVAESSCGVVCSNNAGTAPASSRLPYIEWGHPAGVHNQRD